MQEAPNGISAPYSARGQPVARATGQEDAASKHIKTEGEKKFDTIVYRRWGYYANVGLSLLGVYWVERTKSGQRFIDWIGKKVAKTGIHEDWAKFFARKSFFLTGGFLVIPPMKWLEDKKSDLVNMYNREIYGAKADSDPAIQQSEMEVAAAPKQTWKSIITGRLLSLIPFYLTYWLIWEADSPLGRLTNRSELLKGKSGKEMAVFKKAKPGEYALAADQGLYVDKYISKFSRDIGKVITGKGKGFEAAVENESTLRAAYRKVMGFIAKIFSWLPGNEKEFTKIEGLAKASPGGVKSVAELDPAKAVSAAVDPMHSTGPYYFISEAITSAIVAWSLFIFTRITGPFFGKQTSEQKALTLRPFVPSPIPAQDQLQGTVSLPPVIDMRKAPMPPEKPTKPATSVNLVGLEHQQLAQSPAAQMTT